MAKKTEQEYTRTAVLVTPDVQGLTPYRFGIVNNAPITKTEELMWQEKRKQQLAIEFQKEKTNQALGCIGEMHEHGSDVFYQSISHHTAINEAVRGKEPQSMIEEFHQYGARLEAQHLFRIIDTGAHNIGTIVSQGTYVQDVKEEEPRRGWRKLITG